jgi:hypothetical protein
VFCSKSIALNSRDSDKSGDLAVWILSELLLTLTRFVATGGVEESVLMPINGLADLELPELDPFSAMEL